jgi:hypothetical protein
MVRICLFVPKDGFREQLIYYLKHCSRGLAGFISRSTANYILSEATRISV